MKIDRREFLKVSSAAGAALTLEFAAPIAAAAEESTLTGFGLSDDTHEVTHWVAIYPDDITTAHTLILEPWMNLFLLGGACLAFRRGHVASPRRLLWAGVAIGFSPSRTKLLSAVGLVTTWERPALVLTLPVIATRYSSLTKLTLYRAKPSAPQNGLREVISTFVFRLCPGVDW